MAQLYFKYGSMNSGKSIEILKVAHNYEEQGKPVLIMTSSLDTRAGVGIVASRIGMSSEAVAIDDTMNVYEYIKSLPIRPFCVLIDEAQFLNKQNIYDLARVVDDLNVPVMAFGLKNDFRNELFEGSKYLLLLADKIEEIKTIYFIFIKAGCEAHAEQDDDHQHKAHGRTDVQVVAAGIAVKKQRWSYVWLKANLYMKASNFRLGVMRVTFQCAVSTIFTL